MKQKISLFLMILSLFCGTAMAETEVNSDLPVAHPPTASPDDKDDLQNNPELLEKLTVAVKAVGQLGVIAGVMKECKPEYVVNIEACAMYYLDQPLKEVTNIEMKKNISNKAKTIWSSAFNSAFDKQSSLIPPMSCGDAVNQLKDIGIIKKCHVEDKYLNVIGDDNDVGNGEMEIRTP